MRLLQSDRKGGRFQHQSVYSCCKVSFKFIIFSVLYCSDLCYNDLFFLDFLWMYMYAILHRRLDKLPPFDRWQEPSRSKSVDCYCCDGELTHVKSFVFSLFSSSAVNPFAIQANVKSWSSQRLCHSKSSNRGFFRSSKKCSLEPGCKEMSGPF